MINESVVASHLPYTDQEVVMVDNYKEFADALKRSNEKRKEMGTDDSLQLYQPSQDEVKQILDEGGKLFMTSDGYAGAYVKHDGYMGGLFKDPTVNRKNAAKVLQKARIEAGGSFFDAFGYPTNLESIYIKNGFRPLIRMDFNEAFAPEGWDSPSSSLASKPDNVFYVYDPTYKAKIGEGERNNDYDEGYEIAKNYKP